jgi:hypothetical protein
MRRTRQVVVALAALLAVAWSLGCTSSEPRTTPTSEVEDVAPTSDPPATSIPDQPHETSVDDPANPYVDFPPDSAPITD